MAYLARPALARMSAADIRIMGSIGLAHFVSHFNLMILPPLFDIIREDFGVTFTELGLALVVFNIVSGVLQIPVGFVVDRVGARTVLIAGLIIEAIAFTVVGLVPSFYVFLAMHALAGIGNTVFHPADYAILSKRVSSQSIGFAYSFHTFAGMMGMTLGPATTLAFYAFAGWRGAFIGMMALSWLSALVLLLEPDDGSVSGKPSPKVEPAKRGHLGALRLLASPAIMLNLVFFVLMALSSYGISNYLVVALQALRGTDFGVANLALTASLFMTAAGVMIAGLYVDRLRRHGLLTAIGMLAFAAGSVALGLVDFGTAALIIIAGFVGFTSGVIYPSRDMLVRDVTPPGAFGTVFGFVTSGFNIAGVLAPLIYGALMDRGSPRGVFLTAAAVALLSVIVVLWSRRRPRLQAADPSAYKSS